MSERSLACQIIFQTASAVWFFTLIMQDINLDFLYDHKGLSAVEHSDSTCFCRMTAQNDIVALLDNNGAVVVKYRYDAWGKCVVDASTTNIELANLNPFRYRSYYYDTETGFYFLKTRYYDPEIGRFMTIDDIGYLDPESINGLNLYAYCRNNPIKYIDSNGKSAIAALLIGCIIAFAVGSITSVVSQGFQYGWDSISVAQVFLDGLFAAISVGLAATGICFWASVGIGAAMGFIQYVYSSRLHNESLTVQGAAISILLGGVGGAISGAGARHSSNIAKNLSGRAESGMKALITTAERFGASSKQMKLVNNLYRAAINEGVKAAITKEFKSAAIRICATVAFSPAVSFGMNLGINWGMNLIKEMMYPN